MEKERILHIFTRMPRITTKRLLFRKIDIRDATDMYEYARLPEVTRFLTWQEHTDPEHTKRYIAYLQTRYRAGEFYDFALICRENNKMIGTCGFTRLELDNDVGEVGYVLHPAYWGQGYATEAVRTILRFGFEQLGLHRIEARYMKDNLASRRVMEKCGMVFEGIHRDMLRIKGRFEDIGICACINPAHAVEGHAR